MIFQDLFGPLTSTCCRSCTCKAWLCHIWGVHRNLPKHQNKLYAFISLFFAIWKHPKTSKIPWEINTSWHEGVPRSRWLLVCHAWERDWLFLNDWLEHPLERWSLGAFSNRCCITLAAAACFLLVPRLWLRPLPVTNKKRLGWGSLPARPRQNLLGSTLQSWRDLRF